ncbi:hypothetical protein EVB32_106 [Rhizobium phage RHph_TM39]|nr:hypothetical protein PQC16_gp106 [Rhizobium phage RHph_TM30]QIG71577.1 hypothetical protein EVB94_106 [Rhizobium phage RHph_TM40]QIG71940.1 hypothetical protein EVB95_106 [Rhizobium phage RHph_TM2_3B]QIG72302.1 hypothetical protein EVB96_106 [Rhizobium phage RHph_TM3_3_6]QIG77094.1 hypothetical protein EVB32_106 [Rhizobium phage RHph_TM39]QIG77432.1 hypothetical protein EVB61_104 [Rhizobium phage RHph_TM21B]
MLNINRTYYALITESGDILKGSQSMLNGLYDSHAKATRYKKSLIDKAKPFSSQSTSPHKHLWDPRNTAEWDKTLETYESLEVTPVKIVKDK